MSLPSHPLSLHFTPLPLEQRCRFSLYNLRRLFLHIQYSTVKKTQPEVVYPIIPFPTSRPHFLLILPISSSIFSHLFPLTHVPSSLFPHHSPSPLPTGPFLSPLSLFRHLSLHPCAIATLNINSPSPSLILSSQISSVIPLSDPS
jgi:hypothetical protein